MIEKLYQSRPKSVIAVVGSSPTAKLYMGSECSIAVNGAALLPHKFDYFMCGDTNSHFRRWFDIDCADVRVIAKLVATFDYKLYPDRFDDIIIRRSYKVEQQRSIPKLPDPVFPHLTYLYKPYQRGQIKNRPTKLMFGATISGCAAQLACYMGCKTLQLFGCSFAKSKDHYFYEDEHTGKIYKSMLMNMNHILTELQHLGIRIEIFGESNISVFNRKYVS